MKLTKMIVCGLLLTTSHAFAEDQPTKNFRFCLDSIDQRLGSKDAENLAFWKNQCAAKHDAISNKSGADYDKQKARWDKQLAVIEPLLEGAAKGQSTDATLQAAESASRFGTLKLTYIKSGNEPGDKIKELSAGIELFKQCLAKLATLDDPNWRGRSIPAATGTGGDVEKACKEGMAKAEHAVAEIKPLWEAAGKKRAKELHDVYYVKLEKNDSYPDKLARSKDPLDAIDTWEAFHFLAEEGHSLKTGLEHALKQYPFLETFEVAKGLTSKEMLEKASAFIDKGLAGQQEWKARHDKGLAMFDRELEKSLSGDRLALVKRLGRPSWMSNMTEGVSTVRKGLKSYATAKWFRYDGNACETFYYFAGSKQTKVRREGLGCR